MPEATVHGVLRWRAPTRQRRVLVLRFQVRSRTLGCPTALILSGARRWQPQHAVGEFHGTSELPPALHRRLSPLTHELMAPAPADAEKAIVSRPPASARALAAAPRL